MQRVLIFGATSAIAAEAALIHARRGDRLHLVGRSETKLAELARRCGGAEVTTALADFSELERNEAQVDDAFAVMDRVDRAIIAHGFLGDQLATERSFAAADESFRINLLSVVALLVPLANRMEAARSGRLGVLTSVAGDRGRPRNYTYGASKGALAIYLQGLRSRLHRSGVPVTTLKLGPVDTPMTRNHEKTMLFAKPAAVAEAIVRAVDAGVAEAYVPSFWACIMPVVKSIPEELFQRLPFLSER